MFKPSANQARVLESRGKNIIVSASAGTGKTTVMIEKIGGMIESGQTTLKQLLVVTFTEMAAYEMKKRLVKKLSASQNKEVLSQLGQIDTCAISTLHSFCSTLIRRYFVEAETDPAFKILSDSEWVIARDKVLDDLFDGYYRQGDEGFLRLVEIFGKSRRDDNFKKTVCALYSFKVCKNDFDGWFDDTVKKYCVADGDNYFTAAYNALMAAEFEDMRAALDNAAVDAKKLGLQTLAEYLSRQAGLIFVSRGKNLRQNTEELRQFGGFTTFPTLKKYIETQEQADFASVCKAMKASMQKTAAQYKKMFAEQTYDDILSRMENSFGCCRKIFEVVRKFEEEFDKYKKQNAFLDFNDLEHLALKILRDDRARAEIRDTYKYVFVDEYQDINEIQEAIISLVKGSDNLFLVGDIKQSIYGFRQCAPDIFKDKIQAFGNDDGINTVEYLNDNYRSDGEILDFVNFIFRHIMTADFGGTDYVNTSMLSSPKNASANAGNGLPAVSIDLISFEAEKRLADGAYRVDGQSATVFTKAKAEARQIIRRIRELVGLKITVDGEEKTLGYGDIVILARALKGHAKEVVDELQSADIPVLFTARQSLFDSAEMKQLLNLLRVADNFYDDVALVGCLTGWFGGVSEDALAKVVLSEEDGTLWQKINRYKDSFDDDAAQRIEAFVGFAQKIKFLSKNMSVDRLAAKIMSETDFALRTLGLPDGDLRLKKLNEFFDSLRDKTYNKSVEEFLRYADAVSDAESDVSGAAAVNAVRVMTIHKSKGLEFPVVFVIDCARAFNLKTEEIVCDKTYGAAAKAYDVEERREYDTVSRAFVSEMAKTRMREEEMRILYVAMTRAKYRLYLSGCARGGKTEYALQKDGSYFDWIIYIIKNYSDEKAKYRFEQIDGVDFCQQNARPKRQKPAFTAYDGEEIARLKKRIDGGYRHALATTLELKAVSSNLKPYQLPQEEETAFSPKVVDNADDLPANETGTAYHKVLEKIDFCDRTEDGVKNTIDSLVQSGDIDSLTAAKLDPRLIQKILCLDIFDGIQNKKLYRELPFMLKTEYKNLFDDKDADESIFLQGVLDMLIVDGNSAVIVDYKYSKRPDYIKNRYQKQLDSYAQAVRQILKIDDVRKYVVSIADGAVIEM